uniref:Doublecortin domain-containing protein n=1 Tax=Caenorhabditis japonica TaxID=281687 RepID=A0A8R1I7Z9_CAEJA
MNVLLDVISERIGLINGAKKLYTTGGTQIKDINKIRDGESYVASSSHFTPMSYGGQQAVAKEKPKKTKKKRSKTVHDTERKLVEEEVIIPLNDGVEKVEKRVKKTKKSVKKKMVPHHHGSNETLADTVEVELPSELEDSEEEEADEHSKRGLLGD